MEIKDENNEQLFSQQVGKKEKRKLRAKREDKRSVWSAFGLFGIVGWTIAVPTLAGAAIGKWLDKSQPQSFSWTLTLLLIGLLAGCLAAWRWIKKEHSEMHDNNKE